jgi:hypothetical protein
MPPVPSGPTHEVAADNAVYRRDVLDRYPGAWQTGFWETEVHARFRANGCAILLDPRIVVVHRHSLSPLTFSRQRFFHGRVFGAARFGAAPIITRAIRALAAPAAGATLTARIVGRVFARRRHRARLLASAPYLAWYVACWTAGETAGYLVRPSRSAAVVVG